MSELIISGLPEKIRSIIRGKTYTAENTGMSGSGVYISDDTVLKIEPYTDKTAETVGIMRWLNGKLPVPEVKEHCISGGKSYLLMSKVSGKMSCDEYYLERPDELLTLVAEGLKMLWSIDISDCPRVRDVDTELSEARVRVENSLVDTTKLRPHSRGKNASGDPDALLEWLENNRPSYEPVLSHGDYCLPNIFLDNGRVSGFIDLGDCGIGDKWRDIALCWRSLKNNTDGTFGGKVYPGFNADILFEKLGVVPDHEKLKYYLLLDELF